MKIYDCAADQSEREVLRMAVVLFILILVFGVPVIGKMNKRIAQLEERVKELEGLNRIN